MCGIFDMNDAEDRIRAHELDRYLESRPEPSDEELDDAINKAQEYVLGSVVNIDHVLAGDYGGLELLAGKISSLLTADSWNVVQAVDELREIFSELLYQKIEDRTKVELDISQ